MCVCVLSHVQLFATPWTVAHQAPLSIEFSRQEYWSRLPFSPQGDLTNPGIQPVSLASPALAGRFFTTAPPGKPIIFMRGGYRNFQLRFFCFCFMQATFKVFIKFVTILFLFYVLVFYLKVCGILAPQPGFEPSCLALEGEVLHTGSPRKSQDSDFLN